MERETYNSAVLLVHGIGEQQQGATLNEFGGALVGAARDWLGADSVEDLPIETDLRDGPPQRRAVLVTRPEGEALKVLLAESHWAGEVRAPSWGALMAWLATTVPFLVQRAVDAGMRRSSRGIDRSERLPMTIAHGLMRIVQNVFAVALALAVVIALFVIGLLAGAAPVRERLFGAAGAPGTSSIWARVRALLVGFVGDSYALLHQDGQRSAIVDRVSADLDRLEDAAGDAPVVIVAHSQGAEIVRRVLAARTPGTAPVAGVVTFGAGIAKLHAVKLLRRQATRSWRAFGLRWLSADCVVLAAVVAAGGWDAAPVSPYVVAAGLFALAALTLTVARWQLQHIVGVRFAPEDLRIDERHVAHWTDLHASSDPVSEGDLPVDECTRGFSRTIVNRCSLVHDHVAYWKNAEGFMAAVALEIERVADGRLNPVRPAALVTAERAHKRMVLATRPIRRVAAALVVGLWVALAPGVLAGAAIAVAAAGLVFGLSAGLRALACARTRRLLARHRRAIRRRPVAVG